jgi:S1-C subfamily serine protease
VDRRIARYFGLDKVEGVIVSDVQKKSPAERSGFRVGDIILAANGERITDETSLQAVVNEARTGDTLTLKVMREHKIIDLKLPLEKRSL